MNILIVATLLSTACGEGFKNPFDENMEGSLGGQSIYRGVQITFYGYDDNDDGTGNLGSNAIAMPGFHKVATEDLGTYEQPSTLAAARSFGPKGTRVYIPKYRKYYILEDVCGACAKDAAVGKTRVDLFVGGNTGLQGPTLRQCQYSLTKSGYQDVIIVNPSPNWPVASGPLYKDGVCNTTTYEVP